MLLLRHGRTADNAAGRIQGHLDTPLDAIGREQARAAGALVAAARPDLVLSSDLVRAWGTALAVGPDVRPEPRLRELYLGGWQGLTSAQARERFPAEHTAWRAGRDVPRGGGETYRQAGERAAAAVRDGLADVPADGLLVAVTHGGTARACVGALLGADPDTWWHYAPLGNCCWSLLLEHPRGWRLERHNTGPYAVVHPVRTAASPPAEPVR